MTILVAYASRYGSTRGIAERIAGKLQQMGRDVEVKAAGSVTDAGAYEAFVIGSGVYSGSWLPEATDFVRSNTATLAVRPVWLFSSGPLGEEAVKAAAPEKEGDVVQGEIRIAGLKRTLKWPLPKEVVEFRGSIGPRGHEMFFGALDAKNLPFMERVALLAVRGIEGDYRNWDAIDAWTEQIARELTPAGAAPTQA